MTATKACVLTYSASGSIRTLPCNVFPMQGLQSFDYKSHDVSSIYENRPKDRFQNIYPCMHGMSIVVCIIKLFRIWLFLIIVDDNRVTLKCLPGDDSSDYINASFVGVSLLSCNGQHPPR